MDIPNNNAGTSAFGGLLSAETALKQLDNIQIMIDVMTTKLVEFRGLGLNEFTLKEIRRLEGKLIKHFSQQLEAKQRVDPDDILADIQRYPSLSMWLTVAGVSSITAKELQNQSRSVEDLMRLSECQLQSIIAEKGGDSEDGRKLISALALLKKFQDAQGNSIHNIDTNDLYWDSWSKPTDDVFKAGDYNNHDCNENLSHDKAGVENGTFDNSNDRSRNGSESSSSLLSDGNAISRTRSNTDPSSNDVSLETLPDNPGQRTSQIPSTSSSCLTPPSPSLVSHGSRSSLESESGVNVPRNSLSSSPPPRVSKQYAVPLSTASNSYSVPTPPVTPGTPHKTPQYLVQSTGVHTSSNKSSISRDRVSSTGTGTSLGRPNKLNPNALMPSFNKLKPSKSSEWHIGNHILPSENMAASNQSLTSIATLPPPATSKHFPSKQSKKKKKRPHDLDLYDKDFQPSLNFIDISRSASRRSSTTVSPESTIYNNTSPLSPRTPMTPATPCNTEMWFKDRDVASHISSSPQTPKTPKHQSFKTVRAIFKRLGKKKLKRNKSTEQILDEEKPLQRSMSSESGSRRRSDTLNGSDLNHAKASFRPSTTSETTTTKPAVLISRPTSLIDTERTIIADSGIPGEESTDTLVDQRSSSGDDAGEESTLTEEHDDNDENTSSLTKENLFRKGSMMQSEEWDIPYDQLKFSEKAEKIGCGRFGTVYKGHWHGDVAIRVIDIKHNDEEKLKAFKQEIMIYKKTRHENLELFMGSCMHPPHLAIVTGFCRGHSLYNYIRASKTQSITVNQSKIIAQHIVQGMGYLHSKGIIHKDLKSKNIFVDGKRVVITDFGLVGLHAVSGDNSSKNSGTLAIPDGWLCYLAPEVIKALRFPQSESDDVISTLPYTMKSDVYAFGTVWYELLSGAWPFNGFSAESIIWQVGSGKKQNLSQLQGGKDVKDILMQSWSYDASLRPDFTNNGIMGILKKLQTHIHRSLSSHPRRGGVNRGGSHERLFDGSPLRHGPFSTMHDLAE